MRRRLLAPALLLAGFGVTAHAQSPLGGLADVSDETDADHFSAVRLRAGGLFGYQSPWQYFGVAAQDKLYSQSGWHGTARSVTALWRDQSRDTLAGVNAEVGVVQVSGRTRPIGDVSWALRPAADTGVELLASGGLVETQAALKQGIGYTFWGASIEQKLAERLTVIGVAGDQPFSDGNNRVHLRARLVWDALPEQGINLQARWRQYRNSETDVGGAYFNPRSYQQWLALAGLHKRVAGWTTTGSLGAGREYIRNGDTTTRPAYLAELRSEGPIAGNTRLAVHAQYNRSAGLSSSPGYWWSSIGVTLTVPF